MFLSLSDLTSYILWFIFASTVQRVPNPTTEGSSKMKLLKYIYLVTKRKVLQLIRKDKSLVNLKIIRRLDKVPIMGDNFPSVALTYLIVNKTLMR